MNIVGHPKDIQTQLHGFKKVWKGFCLDDSLLHARNEEQRLDALEKFFARLDEHNIKLHPAKFVLLTLNSRANRHHWDVVDNAFAIMKGESCGCSQLIIF